MSDEIDLTKFNYHIYVISDSENMMPVKIGYTNHPPSRLKKIQTGNPKKLHILGTLSVKEKETAILVEKIIHSHLKKNNLENRGEWFSINAKLVLKILEYFPMYTPFKDLDVNYSIIKEANIDGIISDDEDYDLYNLFEMNVDDYKFINFLSN